MTHMTTQLATFAGGCFWCMVKPFDEQPGIISVRSGYTGGSVKDPTYQQVKSGESGHYEAVQITFDPELFPYEKLVTLYWQQIDPTDDGGQFIDRGSQYRTAIFYHNEEQKQVAEVSKVKMEQEGPFKDPIVTQVLEASTFYEAEEEHQKFYKKNPEKYKQEQEESGRKDFITSHWE
ncbi:peptide-methionine (S)-S-oxide reductase MsrA [Paenalkalicoccus suaedae]|uniref:Peptide methionine sulfoxide reductase MsrA n=1 Tax=Paenalkalicoccus suaedae TaxID=2592382 RepID=A0A859FCY6_9BACI|nr:peptide-methionine (S)-S-oxide reductase MsrA [Paenalkalicoccus suaedae]QKS71213.1 peptide-methionine (S)-S-oxide reductase MsrA [Paenalkalicoccus suaedae]